MGQRIVSTIHIAGLVKTYCFIHYILQQQPRMILIWQYVLLPQGRAYWSFQYALPGDGAKYWMKSIVLHIILSKLWIKVDWIEIRAFRRRALMHSIAMPSLPAFFNDFPLHYESNPMLPFSPFDPAAITTEVDAVCSCHNFRNSVSFLSPAVRWLHNLLRNRFLRRRRCDQCRWRL